VVFGEKPFVEPICVRSRSAFEIRAGKPAAARRRRKGKPAARAVIPINLSPAGALRKFRAVSGLPPHR
jgi:hypothetical protein